MTKIEIGNDQKSVMTKIEVGYVSYVKKSVMTKIRIGYVSYVSKLPTYTDFTTEGIFDKLYNKLNNNIKYFLDMLILRH